MEKQMRGDLRSSALIVSKGLLFGALAVGALTYVGYELPSWSERVLLAIGVWAACRAYYFCFYVLEKYVDPRLKYSGVGALLRQVLAGSGRQNEVAK